MSSAIRVLGAALAAAALAAATQTGASRFALAQVIDPRGKAIVDIGVDDFVVQEAGAGREILDVRVADYPVAIVIDNGRSAGGDFDGLKSAVSRFVDRIGVRPIAIAATADPEALVATFDDDRPAVASKLESLSAVEGAGHPLRALALAGRSIRGTGALFAAVIVATASPIETSAEDLEAATAAVVDSRAVVHIVHNAGSAAGVAPSLRGIADQTHGDYTPIFAAASYQPALDRIASRLTTELLIEYLVPPGSKAADVKIGVRLPGARVLGLGVAPR